jgi:hypothetical protein
MESLVTSHFRETIFDTLFMERRVAQHLEKEKTKFKVIDLTLKKM